MKAGTIDVKRRQVALKCRKTTACQAITSCSTFGKKPLLLAPFAGTPMLGRAIML